MGRLFTINCFVLMVLVVNMATAEVYKLPNQDLIQEDDDIIPGFTGLNDLGTDTYWRRSMLLYKLLKNLQQRDSNDSLSYTTEETWPRTEVKEPRVKRWFSVLNGKALSRRLRPKLCYLKLCSFRVYS